MADPRVFKRRGRAGISCGHKPVFMLVEAPKLGGSLGREDRLFAAQNQIVAVDHLGAAGEAEDRRGCPPTSGP